MRRIVAATLLVFAALSAQAEELDLWIGFGGIQTQAMVASLPEGRISGKVRYVDVVVGSNEKPDQAQGYVFATYLHGAGAGGSCSVFTETATKVKPAVSLLRFSIFYPNPKAVKGPLHPERVLLPPVEYTLKAHLTGAPDVHGSQTNNTHTFKFMFPGGGRPPACVKLK